MNFSLRSYCPLLSIHSHIASPPVTINAGTLTQTGTVVVLTITLV